VVRAHGSAGGATVSKIGSACPPVDRKGVAYFGHFIFTGTVVTRGAGRRATFRGAPGDGVRGCVGAADGGRGASGKTTRTSPIGDRKGSEGQIGFDFVCSIVSR
jgi:hypothetical protein